MPPRLDKDTVTAALADLPDWRSFDDSLHASFDAPDFPTAIALVERIGGVAEELNHHPDIDIRWKKVKCTLSTHSEGGITKYDLSLAQRISTLTRKLGASSTAGVLRRAEIAIDCVDPGAIRDFWRVGLDLQEVTTSGGAHDLLDPSGALPAVWFQKMSEPRTGRNRIHVDVYVPRERAQERVAAVIAAGGRLVTDDHAPSWWVMADAEGNELCVCV